MRKTQRIPLNQFWLRVKLSDALGNPQGSRYNGRMRKPVSIPLTQRQKEIIVGAILGDGSLEFNGFHGTRLQIKQKAELKEYVFWFYQELKNLCFSPPKKKRDTRQWYFGTRFTIELTDYYRKFYQNGKKKIPKEIFQIINSPISIAIWYMDDGTLDWRPKDHYAFLLSVDCYSIEDVNLLKAMLKRNFGIESSICTPLCRGKRYPKLYIGKKGRDRFYSLIKPYLLSCFSHKTPPL